MEENKINCNLGRIFFLLIIIFGVLVNFIVIGANDYRMPVKTDYYINTLEHFSYQDNSEIKLWRLSDIIKIKLFSLRLHISPGDIFIFLGIIGTLYYCLRLIIINFKEKKAKRKLKADKKEKEESREEKEALEELKKIKIFED